MAEKNRRFLQLIVPTPAYRVTMQHAGYDQKTMPPNKDTGTNTAFTH